MPRQSKRAIEDGKRARAYERQTTLEQALKSPKKFKMRPNEVVDMIKEHILKTMGDWMQNNADVHATQGFFYIRLPYRRPLNAVVDDVWRVMFKDGVNLRRHSIGLALRAMYGEVLTGD